MPDIPITESCLDTHAEPPRSRLWVLHERGLFGAAVWFSRNVYYYMWLFLTPSGRKELHFDQLHGVQTGGRILPKDLGAISPDAKFAVEYAPSRPRKVNKLISSLPETARRATFIDIGCGKGRVLIVAADLGFEKLIGIDLSPALIDVARANVELGTKAACQLLCCDATHYEFPPDQLVIYMYNPFQAPVMQKVIANLEASLRVQPRKVFIIYSNPFEEKVLATSSLLRKIGGARHESCIYESI
jgi:SAM-dependent methyltransferase